MFVLREGNSYVCQIDGQAFLFSNGPEKEQARLAAQAHVDRIVTGQTAMGMAWNAGLAERRNRQAVEPV